MPMHHVCGLPQRTQEGDRSPEARVMEACELPCGCEGSKLGLLEDWTVLLTTESSLQPPKIFELGSMVRILEALVLGYIEILELFSSFFRLNFNFEYELTKQRGY